MPGISELLDSSMDSLNFIDENSLISSVSDTIIKPEKKPKKRVCVGMPKKTAKKPARKVKGVEEDDLIQVEASPKRKPAKKAAPKRAPRKKQPEPDPEQSDLPEDAPSPVVLQSNFAPSRHPASKPIKRPSPVPEVEPPTKRMRTVVPRRANSVLSDTGNDPTLRRKLGDITRKFENLDAKYCQLKEVGLDEAATNVEKMRRQCTAMSEASDELVKSLKSQLAAQSQSQSQSQSHIERYKLETDRAKAQAASSKQEADRAKAEIISTKQDAEKLKLELDKLRIENKKLTAKQKSTTLDTENYLAKLRAQNTELVKSLESAQTELKTLSTKLATARATPVPVKESERALQAKIDLYGDLTGLIVRSVKHGDDSETYDCIQTGRNGTLHFKLFVDSENAKTTSFESTEFLYTPLLDGNRDRDLIEIMPDYLAEDITFEREVAAKFYARVVKTLTEVIYEEE